MGNLKLNKKNYDKHSNKINNQIDSEFIIIPDVPKVQIKNVKKENKLDYQNKNLNYLKQIDKNEKAKLFQNKKTNKILIIISIIMLILIIAAKIWTMT